MTLTKLGGVIGIDYPYQERGNQAYGLRLLGEMASGGDARFTLTREEVGILGQAITITASVRNDGERSDDGRIVFEFPSLTDSLDAQRLSPGPAGDAPGYRMFAAGSVLLDRDCQPVTTPHLLVEYADGAWMRHEIDTAGVTVRPRRSRRPNCCAARACRARRSRR